MTPWLAGLAACTVAVAIAVYLIGRVRARAGHALPDHWDTEPTQTDDTRQGEPR